MSSNVRIDNNNNNNRPRFAPSNPARREWVPRGHNPAPSPVPEIPTPTPISALSPSPSAQSNLVPSGIEERDSGRGRHRGNNGGGPRGQSNPAPPGSEERDHMHGSAVPRGRQRRNYGGGPRVQSNPVPPGTEERDTGASHGSYRGNSGGGPRGQISGPMNHFRRESQGRARNNNSNKTAKDSSLPQLLQEIEEKLTTGAVECMICYDMVKRSAPIWSCASCYSIFHLSCIKKWARAPTSADFSTEKEQGVNWRCPGCQSVQLSLSKEIRYLCFCGKRPDPPSDYYLTPHSCGEPCGKALEREAVGPGESREDLCPHVCVLQCHPGPCPPCKQFAPPRICPCGKKTITTRCSDRTSVRTCGQRCEKSLGCGRHSCERTCHMGPCDQCQVEVSAKCFCKNKTEKLLCGEMAVSGEVRPEDGVFSCDSVCGRKLNCGNHFCSDICHPGPCADCELMPSKIKTCHCGKTVLEEQRQSCLDPISTCSQTCKKPLQCRSHLCEETCHAGKCPPCLVRVSQRCRCTSTSRIVECYKTTSDEEFTCEKSCGRKKSCGRHRCSERCCPHSASLSTFSGDEWDPHLCSMPCGKMKRCGQHSCESLCHSGHCPPCLETIFTDLSCACGRTSIPPPLPCGTPPPSCQLACSVLQPCGHSASHICHFGDCPPCSVPISKECVGGHVILRNIPCGSKDITCNKLCGKTRRCGMHVCGRTCHQAPCDTSEPGLKSSCGQTCGAPRRDCRHTCNAQCHPASVCPDVRCSFPVTITCSCARLAASVPCDVGGTTLDSYNPDALYEASVIQKLPVPLQPAVEATGKRIPLGQRKLTCDDECAKLERKRVLADAFDIGTPSLEALHFAASELIQDLYRRDPKWVLAVEERCKYLVLGKSRGTASGMRSHVFCPMVKDKRDAIRVIADRWKLTVSSAGWEPKRFIVVHVTPKSKPPPRVIGVKGASSSTGPPGFDPTVDMDPRLVVSFSDLPREADISALVLRFGGECELVWMNDKNALAVFHDPARAATAMRRLDYGSVYVGAVSVHPAGVSSSASNAWGTGGAPKGSNSQWKKPDELWGRGGGEEWSASGSADLQQVVWKKEAPLAASLNRWTVLEPESAPSTSSTPVIKKSSVARPLSEPDSSEVAEDWETAYDDDDKTSS